METDHSDQSIDKSTESPNMEAASSTAPKFKDDIESPLLSLPPDIFAKIIAFVPIAQWPSLDLLKDFQDANRIAWRGLRDINLDRDLLIKPRSGSDDDDGSENDPSSLAKAIEYLVERSPFLVSLSGIDGRMEPNSDAIRSLAKFEHLQSITMGDAQLLVEGYLVQNHYDGRWVNLPGRVRLDAVVEFLETTRSRTSLRQLQLFNVGHHTGNRACDSVHFHMYAAAMLDRLASSLFNMREYGCNEWMQIRQPFKLEKFSFSSSPNPSLFIRLDSLDATCLTELCLGETNVRRQIGHYNDRPTACVEPRQLSTLIERAPNLRRIELFLGCNRAPREYDCRRPQLVENKQLLAALARHKNLTSIKFDFSWSNCDCLDFAPDFIEMLKSIGRRGQLRKLVVLLPLCMNFSSIYRNEIYSTIHVHIPHLQSIKLAGVSTRIVSNIVSMTELEELHFSRAQLDANTISKISQLPHLKRLAIDGVVTADGNSLGGLANAKTLTDLRIQDAQNISADVFVKWSEGFGSNLQVLMLDGYGIIVDEDGLIRLLDKAVRLRILILQGSLSDRSMMAIAKSCQQLDILGVRSNSNAITVRGLQEIVDRCPKLRRLGGISAEIRSQLQIPRYRNIGRVDMDFSEYDFDDGYYE